MRPFVFLFIASTFLGCTQFPALENTVAPDMKTAEFPELVPLEGVLAATQEIEITEDTQPALEARVARLKARAARLRARDLSS